MCDAQHDEVIQRLEDLKREVLAMKTTGETTESLARLTNGRVTALERRQIETDSRLDVIEPVSREIAEMAGAIREIRRAVLYVTPFAAFFGTAAAAWMAWSRVL